MPNSVSFEKRTGETERKEARQDKADSKTRRLRFKVKGFQWADLVTPYLPVIGREREITNNMTVTVAKKSQVCSQNKCMNIFNIKDISTQKAVQVAVTLTHEEKTARLNSFQLQNPIIISEPVLNTEHSLSLKETVKREPFKLQVWKNSTLWIVYSTAGEWGNHAIRPGMEGNCQMIYNPNRAKFKTQCWTNTSAYKKWCVAIGSTLRKSCETSLLAHLEFED